MVFSLKNRIIGWWLDRGVRFKFIISVLSLFVVGVISLLIFFTKRTETLLAENLKQKLSLLENNFSVIVKSSLLESSYTTLNTLIKSISQGDKELSHLVVMDQSYNILATSSETVYPIFYQLNDLSLLKKVKSKNQNIFFDDSKKLLGRLKIIYSEKEDDLEISNDFGFDDNFSDQKSEDTVDSGEDNIKLDSSELSKLSDEKNLSEESDNLDKEIQGYIYIALTTKYLEAEINQIWLISLLSLLIILAIGGGVAYMIGSNLAKPLASLASKVREISEGNLNAEIHKLDRRDEIGQLVLNTENMRESIKSLTDHLEDKVEQRTYELQVAQNENEKILDTMKTGLLSINSHYINGSQYSKITESIFESKELVGVNFFKILKLFLDTDKLRMTDKYLSILFNSTIDDSFIYDLNPLQKVRGKFQNGSIKYLEFYFDRIYVDGQIVGIMVIIEDITESSLLNKRLEVNQKNMDNQMKQLLAILNIDTQALGMFISDTSEDIAELKAIVTLKKLDEKNLNHIYRLVHSIKGNAALLNLLLISEIAHMGEEEIIIIQKKYEFSSKDMRQINKLIVDLDRSLAQINELIAKLKNFKSSFSKNSDLNLIMFDSINKTINRLGKIMNKGVEFTYDKFDIKLLNDGNRKIIKDILIQIIRNSINHGLETYQRRKEVGKPLNGMIKLLSQKKDSAFFTLIIFDDGRGLDIDQLRDKALRMNKAEFKDILSWNDDQIKELIFQEGFSTQKVVNLTAGRGIGMDIIKRETEKLGGKIYLESEKGKYFKIKLDFPYVFKS